MQKNESQKIAASNRKAFHDYFVEERFEAGIELFGTEVKSIRAGTVNLKDSYLSISDGELFAKGIHISPYEKGNIFNAYFNNESGCLSIKNNELLKVKFDDLCADCNGVFSTKEKATEALYIHKDRCDDIWLDFTMVDSDFDCDDFSGLTKSILQKGKSKK